MEHKRRREVVATGLPLEGIRVLDHGIILAGTGATTMLADMGAEVIRVESINVLPPFGTRGMTARPPKGVRTPGYVDNEPGDRPWDRCTSLHSLQRNKYGITLNLKDPRGQAIYKRIAMISDAVVDNYAPGTMDRMGIGYSALKEVNPGIIMVSASALGAEGPYKGYGGVGASVDAISGMMALRGYPGDDMLIRSTHVWPDNIAISTIPFALLVALYHRKKTGEGQFIDFSQSEAFLPHMGESIMDYTMNKRVPQAMGNRDSAMAPHGCYRCQGDDRWVTIAVSSDEQWQALCHAMGDPVWAKEENFNNSLSRWENQDELNKLIEEWTISRDAFEVMHLLQGVGIAAGPVARASEMYGDPHLKERGFFVEITHREAGTHLYPGWCFQFSKTPATVRIPPNCLGEHNEYILGEILGMSKEEIAPLEEDKVIGDAFLPEIR
ncbi:MAG: CoA transferase [Chloroflexi bacterium]|nr:CoA transferase [Chloroflexota bacterium]